ncbi:MAG: hypothetical protein NT131_07880 [Methanomassiliicoccales archaeon]|nr:hypothetical protein [Methanomassiliicoccales archaeon]
MALPSSLGLPAIAGHVPGWFRKVYAIKAPTGSLDLLTRKGRRTEDYYLRGYNAFLWCLLTLLPLAALIVLAAPYPYSLTSIGLALTTVIIPSYVTSGPVRSYRAEQRSYLQDSPAVVGAMTMSMNRSPSLERALEVGARSGDGALQASLSSVVWKALTGEMQDLRCGVSAWTANLDARNEGLRRSIHLIMAAEEEPGKEGRDRLLDRANSLVLEGMREACEKYVGSLSFPVMLVFTFGVLAPVMLFSLIPLLGLGSGIPDGGVSLNITSLAVVLLALVPTVTVLYVKVLIERNPLNRASLPASLLGKGPTMLLTLSLPLFLSMITLTGQVVISTIASMALVLLAFYMTGGRACKDGGERMRSFVDGLYRLGNGMLGGQDLETSFEDAALMEEGEFQRWGLRMVHAMRTGRTSLIDAVREDQELPMMSAALHQSYLTVLECAREDHRGAGKVAINLAQCQDDLLRTKRRIRENLRSVVDMMTSTSLLFAPAIIGLTSGIMGLLGGDRDWLMAVASVYVVELALVVNYFTSNLDERRNGQEGWRNYGKRGAVALMVFLTASLCGQTFLFRLL